MLEILNILSEGKKVRNVQDKKQESLMKGAKRTIYLPSIPADDFIQYTPDDRELKNIINTYGYCNFISVTNNDSVMVRIELDYLDNKAYDIASSSAILVDMIEYMGFNVRNLNDTTATIKGKIMVIVGFEPPLKRDYGVMGVR